MKQTIFFVLLAVALVISPNLSQAQGVGPCFSFTNNLSVGSRNQSVLKLQQFLTSKGYFHFTATGYFGSLTVQAVKNFQRETGITTTGFVGPATRAKIILLSCGNVATGGLIITSVSGPTSLAVNQQGTWRVQAINPRSGSLTYTVTWGDEPSTIFSSLFGSRASAPVQTSIFQHTYSRSDTFSPTFYVRDEQGNEVNTSLSVRVGPVIIDDGGLMNIRVISPNGGENWMLGEARTISWSAAQIPCGNSPSVVGCPTGPVNQFDVKIRSYQPPIVCFRAPCPQPLPYPSLVIAQNVYGSTFLWSVGQIRLGENGALAPVQAQYQIGVCSAGTSSCDWSDTPFTITTGQSVTSVQVTNPNGGEQWPARSNRAISWSLIGGNNLSTKVDLFLDSYYPPCVTDTCPMYPFRSPVTLDKNVAGNMPYYWIVATDMVNNSIPNGQYQVRVCLAGTSTCDSSDRPFTITNSIISDGNQPPVINGLTGPTSVTVGQTNTWTVSAYDPEGGTLSYSFNWCETSAGSAGVCTGFVSAPGVPSANQLVTALSGAGTYRISVIVTDNSGRSTTANVTAVASWGPNL